MNDLAHLDPTYAADQGAWLHLKHPNTGDLLYLDADQLEPSKPIKIKLAGKDSTNWKAAEQADLDRRLDQAQRNNKLSVKAQDVERRGLKILAAVTLEWENVMWDGKPLSCSASTAEQLYNARTWIREQVDEFVADRKNFGEQESAEPASVMSPEAYLSQIVKNS